LAILIRDIPAAAAVAGIARPDRPSQYKSNLWGQSSLANLDRKSRRVSSTAFGGAHTRVGCALTFASEAKFEIEAKISFRLEAKKKPDFT
jgi:hypothetical protein